MMMMLQIARAHGPWQLAADTLAQIKLLLLLLLLATLGAFNECPTTSTDAILLVAVVVPHLILNLYSVRSDMTCDRNSILVDSFYFC
jgi:hypothetical protein